MAMVMGGREHVRCAGCMKWGIYPTMTIRDGTGTAKATENRNLSTSSSSSSSGAYEYVGVDVHMNEKLRDQRLLLEKVAIFKRDRSSELY